MAGSMGVPIGELVDFSSLGSDIQALIRASVSVRELAYCPYSNFKVGAALLSDEGGTYTGCNVENVSYGDTICAERTAIVKAVSEGKKKFKAIAIVAYKENQIISPCGPCRQFIIEFGSDIVVYLAEPDPKMVLVTTIESLLPLSFH